MAASVNFVWNYCNETSLYAIKNRSKFLSGFDLNNLTAGSSKELQLSSTTVQCICEEFVTRRQKAKKVKLRWRSGKKNLGWVPFKSLAIQLNENTVTYCKQKFKFWKSRDITGKIKCGSICEDSRGRWYLNLVCEVDVSEIKSPNGSEIGVDLGLKTLVTLSNGKKFEANKYYRKSQKILALAQKDKKKKRIKSIHAKIKNRRLDSNHKISTELTKEFQTIYVGNVSSKKLLKTKMAKSVSDASWGQLKTFLEYKAIMHQGKIMIVNEHLTTQTCSCCLSTNTGAPKGVKGLGIREWVCSCCGSKHDRDVNAAINILRLGHQSLSLK